MVPNELGYEVNEIWRSDWHTYSALLLFSYTPAREMSPSQFSSISFKWYWSCGKKGLCVPNKNSKKSTFDMLLAQCRKNPSLPAASN